MNTRKLGLSVLAVVLVLTILIGGLFFVVGGSGFIRSARASSRAPETVVKRFYQWYLDYPGNVLVDRAYHGREEIAPELVQKVDAILDSFNGGGYDPFLCAQDIPEAFNIDPAVFSGGEARVLLHEFWNVGTQYQTTRDVSLILRRINEQWRIVDIVCPGQDPTVDTPELVVERFYLWYLDYARNTGNPLVDRAYRTRSDLMPEWIQSVDNLLHTAAGYDPFLCAQDIPESFMVGQAAVSGEQATLTMLTSFPGHSFTVALELVSGTWKIFDIVCQFADITATPTPGISVPTPTSAMPAPTSIPDPTGVPTIGPAPTGTVAPVPTPALTPVPTSTPLPAVKGWLGEYYANRTLSGAPVLLRDDAEINFTWGNNSPGTVVPSDGFSARWTRTLYFRGGTYHFYARSDDGIRVWLDGDLIIDQWHDSPGVVYMAERGLGSSDHSLRVEYFENAGAASLRFWWELVSDYPQWRGEYFPNLNLVGTPVLVRNDQTIDFNWGRNSPAEGIPADNFSARWTRVLPFDGATYRFHAIVDDGVRLYIDNALVIDEWRDGARREVTGDRSLAAGNHSMRVEYYDRAAEARIHVWWEKVSLYPDWRGEYWDNRHLEGTPLLVRNDPALTFDWGRRSPAPELPADNFSARWTRTKEFDAAIYRFRVVADEGARLWVDDHLVIDAWKNNSGREVTGDYVITRGKHTVRVEYYERTGDARIQVLWDRVNTYPDWQGSYWDNRRLEGAPFLVRNDVAIDFDWRNKSPIAGMPSDNFSVRWSRQVNLTPGRYRFHAWVDDGIRLYIDGERVLDEWHDRSGDGVYSVERLLSGQHRLVVEYYERQGEALVKLWWERIGDWPTPTSVPTQPPVIVPTSTPRPTSPPQPTATVQPTATPLPTSTRVPTVVPTHTPQPTATVPPTVAPTVTPKPPIVPTATPQPTFTPLPTATPKPTITPVPLPVPVRVRINEILPVPASVDWDGNGSADEWDEWIELYNEGADPAAIGGWWLDDAEGGSTPYTIPAGTVLQPGAYAVFYRQQTGLVLDDSGDRVRLLVAPSGVVDRVVFDTLPGDASYSRDEAGSWHTDWPPSPGAPNRPAGPTPDRSRQHVEGAFPVETGVSRLIELENESAADASWREDGPPYPPGSEAHPSWPMELLQSGWWE
jgi:hypothetical protein